MYLPNFLIKYLRWHARGSAQKMPPNSLNLNHQYLPPKKIRVFLPLSLSPSLSPSLRLSVSPSLGTLPAIYAWKKKREKAANPPFFYISLYILFFFARMESALRRQLRT